MAYADPTSITFGQFGVGQESGRTITFGLAIMRLGDEWNLIFADDGAGTYDELCPVAIADDGDSTVTILNQDLDADLSDTNTKLLLSFEGLDESTTIIDRSPSGHTMTAGLDAQIDTAQFVFGVSSLLLDGNDFVSLLDHADFTFRTNDLTIDLRVRFNSFPGGVQRFYFEGNPGNSIDFYLAADGTVHFKLRKIFVTVLNLATADLNLQTGTGYHISIVRDGNDWTIREDGVTRANATAAIDLLDVAPADGNIYVGALVDGWIDEFRVVNGEAKWTADFTPPTDPYGTDDLKTTRYRIHGVSPGGIISDYLGETPVTVTAHGDLHYVAGNDPTDLTLTLTTNGACILRWRYSEVDEPARPTGFKIYRLIAGVYTYVDSVAFVSGIISYEWPSDPFGDGVSLDFTVRTYRTVSGTDYEQITNDSATGTADAVGPAAPTSLAVTT